MSVQCTQHFMCYNLKENGIDWVKTDKDTVTIVEERCLG